MNPFSTLHISVEAAAAYSAAGPALIDFVNREIASAPEVNTLIGGNPLEVLYANHRHHHGVICNVMKFGAWQMLHEIIPWVYRSYVSHGFSYAYFPRAFRAWQGAVEEHTGAAFSQELNKIYDLFLEHHEASIVRSQEHVPHGSLFKPPYEALSAEVITALTSGDASGVINMGEKLVTDASSLADLYMGLLTPAMIEIGHRWEEGRLSVAHEHLASGVVNRVMAYWYHHILSCRQTKGKALITAGPGEFHAIGSAILADLLSIDGWQTIQLGANTPTEDLLIMMDSFQPDIVGISVAMPFNIHNATAMIVGIHHRNGGKCKIMVGGQAFAMMPAIWRQTGADHHAATNREAVAWAADRWND